MGERMSRINNYILVFIVFWFILSPDIFAQQKLPASTIKTIYITPSSHYDFGFVEAPDQVRERASRHIDEVIRVAESEPGFRWTIESVWQVNEWLKRQRKPTSVLPKDKEKIARLMNLIRSGRIGLSTAWGSMHTDFMGGEELNRLCYDYAVLKRSYGVTSELAMMNDVPGHPTSLPSVLAGSGTKYLVTGANIFIGVATSLAPGKVPFYWESPDGSRILTWISQGRRGGYVEGLTDFYLDPYSLDPYTDKKPFDMFNPTLAGKKTDIEVMEIGVTELLNRYNAAGYKYDAVMAMYAHDFIEPTDVSNLERAVALWNKKHDDVKLRLATPTEFLKYIETKYGASIPTYRGEWSGLWSEAKTQSPRISALARYAHDQTPAMETLWSAIAMTRLIPAPVGNFAGLYDLMLTYDEHSGAGNNGWPQLNSRGPLDEQNRQYVRYMTTARDQIDFLFKKGIGVLAQPGRYDKTPPALAGRRQLVVYNGSSWQRSDVVRTAAVDGKLRITAIRDASGKPVRFDIDESGNAIFVAKDIPSFGYSTYEVTTVPGVAGSTLIKANGTTAQNRRFSVKLRPDGNIESIRDLASNREIVNNGGERPFNDLLRVEGSEASNVVYPLAPRVSISKGLQMTQISVRRDRSVFPVTIITIYDDLDRVEIHNELDPAHISFVGGSNNWNDSYYFAFPFNVSKDALKVLRGGQKWFDRLPDDYLPGARRDSVTTQHLLAMSSNAGTAMIAHRQAFHWAYPSFVAARIRPQGSPAEFPAMFTGKFPLPEATIYSRAFRSSSQADTHDLGVVNMETVEPGLTGNYVYDYAIAADSAFDSVKAWRLGSDFNLPFRTEYVHVAPTRPSYGFFSIDRPNVAIVNVKPLSDSVIRGEVSAAPLDPKLNKTYVVRLQEYAGQATTVRLGFPVKLRSAAVVNLTEDTVIAPVQQIEPMTVAMKPYQTLTIKFEIE